jgi:hypothetical protein
MLGREHWCLRSGRHQLRVPEEIKQETSMITIHPLVFQVVLALSGIIIVTLVPFYVIRRNKFPIQQRLPSIVIVELVSLTVACLQFLAIGAFPSASPLNNCKYTSLVKALSIYCTMLTTMYRIGWLFIKEVATKVLVTKLTQSIAADRFAMLQEQKKDESLASRVIYGILNFEWRYITGEQSLLLHMLPLVIVGCVDIVFVLALNPGKEGFTAIDSACLQLLTNTGILKISGLSYALIHCFLVSGSIRKMDDNFKIGIEVRLILLLCLFTIPINSVLFFLSEVQLWSVFDGLSCAGFIIALTAYPIKLSFDNDEKQKTNEMENKHEDEMEAKGPMTRHEQFMRTLETPELRNLFLKYLQSEFSVENLAFYEQCVQLEKNIEDGKGLIEIVEQARFIRDNFISSSAPLPVNIPFEIRKRIMHQITEAVHGSAQLLPLHENGDLDFVQVLKPAKDYIFKLMISDSFLRFRATDKYREYFNDKRIDPPSVSWRESIRAMISITPRESKTLRASNAH